MVWCLVLLLFLSCSFGAYPRILCGYEDTLVPGAMVQGVWVEGLGSRCQ